MVAQLYAYTKIHWIEHFGWIVEYVNYTLIKDLFPILSPQSLPKKEAAEVPSAQQVTYLNNNKPFPISQMHLKKIDKASILNFSSSSLYIPFFKMSAQKRDTEPSFKSKKCSPDLHPL